MICHADPEHAHLNVQRQLCQHVPVLRQGLDQGPDVAGGHLPCFVLEARACVHAHAKGCSMSCLLSKRPLASWYTCACYHHAHGPCLRVCMIKQIECLKNERKGWDIARLLWAGLAWWPKWANKAR